MRKMLLTMIMVVFILLFVFGATNRLLATNSRQNIADATKLEVAVNAEIVNRRISYQGFLTDPSTGDPLTDSFDMTFTMWDGASDGNQIGTAIVKNDVAVANGLFNVTLDISDETFDGQGRWIQLQVGSEVLMPRREILPVPYALSLRPGATISGTLENQEVIRGINKATSGWSIGVTGGTDSAEGVGVLAVNTGSTGGNAINAWSGATSGFAAGVFSESHSPEGYGVFGINDATTSWATGVIGISKSPDGHGINGLNEATTGNAVGVSGESRSATGIGVLGTVSAPVATGAFSSAVKGEHTSASGFADGVTGISHSPDGSGVSGFNVATSGGNGVWGGTNAADGNGIKGVNNATSGWAPGVYGTSSSPEGVGVSGSSSSSTGMTRGVFGNSSSPDGRGVEGINEAGGIGVAGRSNSDWGVLGESGSGTGVVAQSHSGNLIEGFSASFNDIEFSVSNDGNVYADGSFQSPAADFAELLPANEGLEPGDVLIISKDGQLALSTEAHQTSVVGVYSTAPAFLGGATEEAKTANHIPLAVVGIVPVKVSAENGSIEPGDLLTTSTTPGYAMVCADPLNCVGAIVGKALEPLIEGVGIISVLITLQ